MEQNSNPDNLPVVPVGTKIKQPDFTPVVVEYKGEQIELYKLCRERNISIEMVKRRIKKGMSLEDALSKPPNYARQRPKAAIAKTNSDVEKHKRDILSVLFTSFEKVGKARLYAELCKAWDEDPLGTYEKYLMKMYPKNWFAKDGLGLPQNSQAIITIDVQGGNTTEVTTLEVANENEAIGNNENNG